MSARLFVVWRRRRGSGDAWEKLPGAHEGSATAMKAISDSELSSPPDAYEFTVQFEGVQPRRYGTRELRPNR